MWSVAAAIEEMMVVSEIGEEWSPKTPPERAAATKGETGRPSVIEAGTTIGSMMAKVPQLVPVAKAMPDATRKTSGRKTTGGRTPAVTWAT
jgi:hypothetical protein